MVPGRRSTARRGQSWLLGALLTACATLAAEPAGLGARPAYGATACRPAAPAVAPTAGRSLIVERGPAECHTVALTFDTGADRGYAELILDILRE